MRNPRLTNERGMALAAAIFALVVIGALVAGAFYASTMEQRTGRNSMYAAEAAQAAETRPHGRHGQLGPVRPQQHGQRLDHLARHHIHDRAHRLEVHVSATRLNDQLYLLTSLGTRVDPTGAELPGAAWPRWRA